jgi:hypothetical protein
LRWAATSLKARFHAAVRPFHQGLAFASTAGSAVGKALALFDILKN